MLAAALAAARRGWRVFPLHAPLPEGGCTCRNTNCDRPAKHPVWQAVRNGHLDATTDEMKISDWYAPSTTALPNIGIYVAASGMVVVDVDGARGRELLARVLDGREPPTTMRALSGREGGGEHLYFRCPPGLRFTRFVFDGESALEIKHRGYVVMPPSVHISGRRYAWVDASVPPAPPPAWLLARSRPATESSRSTPPSARATVPANLDHVRMRLRRLRNPESQRRWQVVLDGLPYARPSARNTEAYRLASILAGVAPTEDPADLAVLFRASTEAMACPEDTPPSEAMIADMIERSQDDLRAKRESERAAWFTASPRVLAP